MSATLELSPGRREVQRRTPFTVDLGVDNPFAAHTEILIPKGTVIRTMEPGRTFKRAGRSYMVRVHHTSRGYVETSPAYVSHTGVLRLPVATWAGTSGYWCDVQVTAELCAANGVEVPTIGVTAEDAEAWGLDCIPSFEDGYNDAWRPRADQW